MWYRLYRFFKEYFYLSSYQQKAVIFLLVIFVIITVLTKNIESFYHPQSINDTALFEQYKNFLGHLKEKEQAPYYNRLDQYILKRYDTLKLFPFNPNTVSYQELLALGLTEKQAKTIINYRNKGGRFRIKEDFRKIYGIRYLQYKILKPYILLPEKLTPKKKKDLPSKASAPIEYFAFDPNTITEDSLMLLGFSQRQARSIINARSKGWHFRTKKDFAKLYAVSQEKFNELEAYILLPDSLTRKKSKPKQNSIKIEINSATTDDFIKALRIKKYLAERIIKYRDRLGGYYSVNQMAEVYGLSLSRIKSFRNNLTVDTNKIRKINIKTSDFNTLVHHPYIDGTLARWIINHRNKRKFTSVEYLKRYKELQDYEYRDLVHYLTLE